MDMQKWIRQGVLCNADTTMKKEAIEKATSDFDPLFSNEYDIDWEDDEDLLKKLYGLK